MQKEKLTVAAVLSGNRNFEGRINPLVRANYLASPPLVVAYALAGRVDIDLANDPLGSDQDGKDVFLQRHLAVHRRSASRRQEIGSRGNVRKTILAKSSRATSVGTR